MQPRSVSSDGVVAALPIAAGFAILLARWLPIHFEYVPNDLGIVSLATLARYPAQQEMFWYVYALAVCALGTWGLARVFRRSEAPIASIAWAEVPDLDLTQLAVTGLGQDLVTIGDAVTIVGEEP